MGGANVGEDRVGAVASKRLYAPYLHSGGSEVLGASSPKCMPAPEGGTGVSRDRKSKKLGCSTSGVHNCLLGWKRVRCVRKQRRLVVGSREPANKLYLPADRAAGTP